MINEKDLANELIKFIDRSPTAFHVVENIKEILDARGFKELDPRESWIIEEGGAYYSCKNQSALAAFEVSSDLIDNGFKIVAGHTDSPGFRIKPQPEILAEGSYLKLNTEVYGGPIYSSWFDRPLSLAGRVSIVTENILEPKDCLVNIDRSILTIPNLAIHMNREVNSGFNINPQIHTQALAGMVNKNFEKDNYLLGLLAKELGINYEDILDFELYLYSRDKGEIIGLDNEFISAGKLDDLAMVYTGLRAFLDGEIKKGVNILVAFDNEEIGSDTKQGAASPFFKNLVERIVIGLGLTRQDYFRALENSFIISADLAHGLHPNFMDKTDPTNRPVINAGPVIKMAANQAYTTDSRSSAIYQGICRSLDIPVQKFVNRSDLRGGSTIGPISSSQLPISSVDVGTAILAMHSVRELAGVRDTHYIYQTFKKFYSI